MSDALRKAWDAIPDGVRPPSGERGTRWFVELEPRHVVEVVPPSDVPRTLEHGGAVTRLPDYPGRILRKHGRPDEVVADDGRSRLKFVSVSGSGRDPVQTYHVNSDGLEAEVDLFYGKIIRDGSTAWVEDNYAYVRPVAPEAGKGRLSPEALAFIASALQALPLSAMPLDFRGDLPPEPVETRRFMAIKLICDASVEIAGDVTDG